MRIVGIDPGFATVGLGIIDAASPTQLVAREWMTITTEAGLPLGERLQEIYTDTKAILEEVKPELIVIEKLFFETNKRTAIDVSQARGVLLLAAQERSVPILEPTPLQMKQAITGDGSADKLQVQTMLLHLLHLTEIPQPDDAADALSLAIYGALAYKTLTLA